MKFRALAAVGVPTSTPFAMLERALSVAELVDAP
jgi:hypothetical protein